MFEIREHEKRDLNLSLSFGISAGRQQLEKIIFLPDSNSVSRVNASSIWVLSFPLDNEHLQAAIRHIDSCIFP